MLLPALIIMALGFLLLAPVRLAGAQRARLLRMVRQYGFAAAVTAVALLVGLRGQEWAALALGALALMVWSWPDRPRSAPPRPDLGDAEARAVLGVGPQATAEEIKAAFRAKMRVAHPDRGGDQDAAAKLVAARDRLLRRR